MLIARHEPLRALKTALFVDAFMRQQMNQQVQRASYYQSNYAENGSNVL